METPIVEDNEWVDFRHPHWEENVDTWAFIEAHYDGKALKIARKKAQDLEKKGTQSFSINDKAATQHRDHPILWRRISTESINQFIERAFTSRFPRVMAAIVDSFSGAIEGVEAKDVRTYDEVWKGPPEEEKSLLHAFWKDADGRGSNFPALVRRQAGRFSRLHRVWVLVETDKVVFAPIQDVVNWRFEGDRLVEVLIRETGDPRKSLKEEFAKPVERYVYYTVEGWTRFEVRETSDDKEVRRDIVRIPEGSGVWKFPHYGSVKDAEEKNNGMEDRPDRRVVPLNMFDLDLDGFPGEDMAEGANYLFNLLSDARNILRQSNFPYWVGDVDNDAFKETVKAREQGWNMLQGDWKNVGPDPEIAKMAFDTFRSETEAFFIEMHQLFEQSTRDKTAEEVSTNDTRGRRSFLSTETRSLEEMENWIWFMFTQKNHPNNPGSWMGTSVKRSRDFQPIDTAEWARELTDRVFGKDEVVPAGEKGRIDAAKKILRLLGVEFDDDELEAAVKAQEAGARAGDAQRVEESRRVELINNAEEEAQRGTIPAREAAIDAGGNG